MNLTDTIENVGIVANKKITIGERILVVLKEQKRTRSWLASEIGISKQAMNYLLKRSSTTKFLNEIAMALEVNPEWLRTGEGNYILTLENRNDIRLLPILNMADIIKLQSGEHLNKNTDHTIIVDHTFSPKCFSVLLDNCSMKPLFNEGTVLVFDPTKEIKSGDFIIFSITGTNEVLFRQYFSEGKDVYLKAVDTMYKIFKNEKITIHGALIESRNCFT